MLVTCTAQLKKTSMDKDTSKYYTWKLFRCVAIGFFHPMAASRIGLPVHLPFGSKECGVEFRAAVEAVRFGGEVLFPKYATPGPFLQDDVAPRGFPRGLFGENEVKQDDCLREYYWEAHVLLYKPWPMREMLWIRESMLNQILKLSSIISTSSTTLEEQLLDFWIGGFDDMVHFSTSATTGDLFGALKPPKTEVFFFWGGDLEIWK